MATNKVIYGNSTLIDLTNDDVTPEALAPTCISVHSSSGNIIVGSFSPENYVYTKELLPHKDQGIIGITSNLGEGTKPEGITITRTAEITTPCGVKYNISGTVWSRSPENLVFEVARIPFSVASSQCVVVDVMIKPGKNNQIYNYNIGAVGPGLNDNIDISQSVYTVQSNTFYRYIIDKSTSGTLTIYTTGMTPEKTANIDFYVIAQKVSSALFLAETKSFGIVYPLSDTDSLDYYNSTIKSLNSTITSLKAQIAAMPKVTMGTTTITAGTGTQQYINLGFKPRFFMYVRTNTSYTPSDVGYWYDESLGNYTYYWTSRTPTKVAFGTNALVINSVDSTGVYINRAVASAPIRYYAIE